MVELPENDFWNLRYFVSTLKKRLRLPPARNCKKQIDLAGHVSERDLMMASLSDE
jgi:hypothetical protein